MMYMHEPTGTRKLNAAGPSQLYSVSAEDVIEVPPTMHKVGAGRLRAPGPEKLDDIAPLSVWRSFESTGKPPDADNQPLRITSSKKSGVDAEVKGYEPTENAVLIQGIPDYKQSYIGKHSCGPSTFLTMCGYWDMNGYGVLIDRGEGMTNYGTHFGGGTTWYEAMTVYGFSWYEAAVQIGHAVDYSPTFGTWPDTWLGVGDNPDEGMRNFWSLHRYSNMLSASVAVRDATWARIKDQVDKGNPQAYCWFLRGDLGSGHWSTIGGYDDVGPGKRYMHMYTNWGYTIWINNSNVPSSDEWCMRMEPRSEKFDTVWSDDFENFRYMVKSYYMGSTGHIGESYSWTTWPWQRVSTGATQSFWSTTTYRAHAAKNDDYPFGKQTSYSIIPHGSIGKGEQNYPPNLNTMLIFGPFSTLGRTKGEFGAFFYGSGTDFPDDYFAQAVSLDGVSFHGNVHKETNGKWRWAPLQFDNVPNLGSVLNKNKVWVAFLFHSDGDTRVSRGQFVDDARILLWPYNPEPLPTPNAPFVTNNLEEHIRVSAAWVPGTTHYRILRKGRVDRDFVPVTGWQESNIFYDEATLEGEGYEYRTQAAESPTGTRASALSEAVLGFRRMRAPKIAYGNADFHGATHETRVWWWKAHEYHNYFRVYRSDDANPNDLDKYAAISGWIADTHFYDRTAIPGKTCYYRVTASGHSSGTRPSGLTTDYAMGVRKLENPKNLGASQGAYSDKVVVSWSAVPHATHYRVYRAAKQNDPPQPITGWITPPAPPAPPHIFDTPPTPLKNYFYWVKPARDATGAAEHRYVHTGPVSGYLGLAAPTGVTASQGTHLDKIAVSWNAVAGASHYRVWASETPGGQRTMRTWWQTGTTFDDTSGEAGKVFHYTVEASASFLGTRPSLRSSPAVAGWKKLPAPTGVVASKGTEPNRVLIYWNPVPNAEYYYLWRQHPSSLVAKMASLPIYGNTTVDAPPEICTEYKYYVRAETSGGSSALSAPDTGWRGMSVVPNVAAGEGTRPAWIQITWDAVPQRYAFYRVYRATSRNARPADREAISDWVSHQFYFDTSAELFTDYYYWVRSAKDANGYCPSGWGDPAKGWLQTPAPGIQASDGHCTDKVEVWWDEIDQDTFFRLYRSETSNPDDAVVLTGSDWISDTFFDDFTAVPGRVYYYWARAALTASGDMASDYSDPPDTGWRGIAVASQPPNMTDGSGTTAFKDAQEFQNIHVFDDWQTGSSPAAVHRVRWWGSYPYHEMWSSGPVAPPAQRPSHYMVRYYASNGATPPRPGNLLGEYAYAFGHYDSWIGSVEYSTGQGSAYRHVYQYECELPAPWDLEADTLYLFSVQGVYDSGQIQAPWEWWNSETANLGPAFRRMGASSFVDYSWPTGHRLEGQQMDMAFQLIGKEVVQATPTPTHTPTPTESPTETPTPIPTPDPSGKIIFPPNRIDGLGLSSYVTTDYSLQAFDDWVCPDGEPIIQVQWWGCYFGYESHNPNPVAPPTEAPPVAFLLHWYSSKSGPDGLIPDQLLASETCTWFHEYGGEAIPIYYNPESYYHLFTYEATLATPWDQIQGQTYFLSIQAVFDTGYPYYSWGWFSTESHTGSGALQGYESDGGMEYYDQLHYGHRLEGQLVNHAFALLSELSPLPPPPTLTPTPSPTPSPSPTDSPTPTASPTPTPDKVQWNQPPNTYDGSFSESYQGGSSGGGAVGTRRLTAMGANTLTADDWQSLEGRPIVKIRWQGIYPGWMQADPTPLGDPGDTPKHFELKWHEVEEGTPDHPGSVLATEVCANYNETYLASFENPAMPGTYLHVFTYECTLQSAWQPQAFFTYMLSIQAVFEAEFPLYGWAWTASDTQWNNPAVISHDGVSWNSLTWPIGHRLEGQFMDMAFEMEVDMLPTPTPTDTPTLTPTPSPTPSPTPEYFVGTQLPNLTDGYGVLSSRDDSTTPSDRIADDWDSPSETILFTVRWWGSYPAFENNTANEVETPGQEIPLEPGVWPDRKPLYFTLSLYEAEGDPAYPGQLVHFENCWDYNETWVASVPKHGEPGKYEHVCEYTARLIGGWEVEAGKKYFFGVQAVFMDGVEFLPWGWFNSETANGRMTHVLYAPDHHAMGHLFWPGGHRLADQPMDMAYELLSWALPLPDPTPTPIPTASPSPTPVQPDWFTLTLATVGGGDVSANPDQESYAPGSDVTITAKGDKLRFVNWTGNVPPGQETASHVIVTMDSNKSLTANFEPATWTLEATADQGTVTRNPSLSAYPDGTTVQLTANIGPGFIFDKWENQRGPLTEEQSRSNPLTLVIEDDMILRARVRPTTDVWVVW
jgi:hypothetical protein